MGQAPIFLQCTHNLNTRTNNFTNSENHMNEAIITTLDQEEILEEPLNCIIQKLENSNGNLKGFLNNHNAEGNFTSG